MIAFYYGLTGFACVIYYRRELFNSARNFVMIGVLPDARRADAAGHPREVLHRPERPGQLRVRRLVARPRTAAGHRDRLAGLRRACSCCGGGPPATASSSRAGPRSSTRRCSRPPPRRDRRPEWPSRSWATTEPRARAPCSHAVTALAAELGDSLVVVFAYQVSRLGGEVHDYEEVLREHGRTVLEEARAVAGEAGVEIELVMRESSPAEALIEVADEHDARLHRRRLLRRAPAQERARRVDADTAAAPLRAARSRRPRARVMPAPVAAPCAPRRGSATLLARMTSSLALRLLLLPPRGE